MTPTIDREGSTVGTRVAITAAGRGIGLAVARAFAAQGARVHVCDIDAAAVRRVG